MAMLRVGSNPEPEVLAVEVLRDVPVKQEHANAPGCARHYASSAGDDGNVQVVTCGVAELRPHPSYIRHKLAVPAIKLSALQALGNLAFSYPLVITRDRF